MPATKPKSLTWYTLACVIGAIVLVVGINNAYWLAEPFPGGMSARERLPEFGWLKDGIADLVLFWSIPIGLVAFFSLFGLCAALLELDGEFRGIVAITFLYPILVTGCWPMIFFLAPLFVGIIAALILLAKAIWDKNELRIVFSLAALLHNGLSAVLAYFYCCALFEVFGG